MGPTMDRRVQAADNHSNRSSFIRKQTHSNIHARRSDTGTPFATAGLLLAAWAREVVPIVRRVLDALVRLQLLGRHVAVDVSCVARERGGQVFDVLLVLGQLGEVFSLRRIVLNLDKRVVS